MSNEHNDRWLETYYEALEDRCFELNGKRQDGKYQAIHLIDFLEPSDSYSVGSFRSDVIEIINSFCEFLKIKRKMEFSSNMSLNSSASDRIIEI